MMGSWTQTYEFLPTGEDATELRIRIQRLRGKQRVLYRLIRRKMSKDMHTHTERLARVLRDEKSPPAEERIPVPE
jgi:hypothetical protein